MVKKEIPSKKTVIILVLVSVVIALLTLILQSTAFSDVTGSATVSEEEVQPVAVEGQVFFTVTKPVTEEVKIVFNVVEKGEKQ